MSPPTKQLGQLSLDENMPTTRSQAHRRDFRSPPASSDPPLTAPGRSRSPRGSQKHSEDAKRERGRGRRRSSRRGDHHHHHHQHSQSEGENDNSNNEESSSSDAIAPRVLAAKSRIVYDVESLEMECRARALAGLTGQFDVVYCRENSPFYEFQLIERPRIRICDEGAECTCSEYGNRPDMACRHIFWLVDQVYDSMSPSAPPSPSGLPLSRDGFSPKLPPVHTILNNRLESLAAHLEWPFIPTNEATTASRLGYGEAIAGGLSRQEQVRDIMSAFNKVTLPEDFRKDLVEKPSTTSPTPTTPRTPEQCVVQGDFEATLFRLAVHDDNVYSSIRKAMPAGACAAIYFDKVQQLSRNLLLHFDEYRRSGRLPSGRRSLEVREVASELRQHVQKIRHNLAVRVPYGTKGAVEALITLLQDVSARNIDAFENSPWGRIAPAGEDADDRNLYEQLIGQANNNSSTSSRRDGGGGEEEEGGGLFILDVLGEVPASVLASYLSNLFDILAKVEINRAPSSFVLKLKALIQNAQSSEGVTSRVKRPATAEAGGSQKRAR